MNKKKSYERRVYESVDDNSLSYALSQKLTKKKFMQQTVNPPMPKFCFPRYNVNRDF